MITFFLSRNRICIEKVVLFVYNVTSQLEYVQSSVMLLLLLLLKIVCPCEQEVA